MTPEIAKVAMQFMMRVQLQGQEVPAFNAVMSELSSESDPISPPKSNGSRDGGEEESELPDREGQGDGSCAQSASA